MKIDMPPLPASFEERGRWLVNRLVDEFRLSKDQAAGIVGNLGFESGGLKILQETHPIAGRGGRGWAMWTGPRRRAFEAWCNLFSALDPDSDEANFGYLLIELHGDYKHTIDTLRSANTLGAAVFSVGQTYETPAGTTWGHLPGYDDRLSYARRALGGTPTGTPVNPISLAVRALQASLAAAGFYHGNLDGEWGPLSETAIAAYRESLK